MAAPPVPPTAEPDVAKILEGIGRLTDLTKELVDNERLAAQLPLIEVSPASARGLNLTTLFEDGLYDALADGATDLNSLTKSLTDEPIGEGRTVTLESLATAVGTDKVVDVTATFSKTLQANLFLADDDPRLSLRVADGANVTLSLETHLIFVLEDDTHFYLRKDAASPRFTLNATASLGTAADPDAALGILGVDVTGTLTYAARITGTIDDPDGNGRLAFTEPGGGDGELAVEGAVDGLFSFAMQTGQGVANRATGTFTVTSEPLVGFTGTPISATVGLLWDDLAVGEPQLTIDPTVLQQVQAFQNMSAQDLVSGIDQLVSLVGALQRAPGNLSLPFMRGRLADVVDLSEHLRRWLVQNTEPASAGDEVAGSPTFASLQEMLSSLDDLADVDLPGDGADLEVTTASYDGTAQRFRFALSLERDDLTASPVADSASDLASTGTGVTYTTQTLVDPNAAFPVPNGLQGRVVQAGTSAGYIESNTATTITLRVSPSAPEPTVGWVGGTPLNGNPYRVQGSDSLTGQVEFGNLFEAGSGLRNANAAVPRAQVVPRYDAQLQLALDLSQPRRGAACDDPDLPGEETCPFPKTNRDGTTVLVTEQPLPAERFLLDTGYELASASLPISTMVEVNGGIGFVKVRLGGSLAVCAVGDPAQCAGDPADAGDMFAITLEDVGEIPFPALFERLVDDPGSLVDLDASAQVYANLTATVPGATDLGVPAITAQVSDTDITQDPAPSVTTTGFDALADFNLDPDNPKALLGQIVRAIQVLAEQLDVMSPEAAGPLKDAMETPIPVVGQSLQELIAVAETGQGTNVSYGPMSLTDTDKTFGAAYEGRTVRVGTMARVVADATGPTLIFTEPWGDSIPAPGTPYAFRSELVDLADQITRQPPDYLQDLLLMINRRLGQTGVPIAFSTQDIGGTPHVVIRLNWQRQVSTSTPMTFDVSGASLVGAMGSGETRLTASGNYGFGLALPLGDNLTGPADASQLLVTRDSHATIGISADASGALAASVGPLSVSLGKQGGSGDELVDAHARYQLGIAGPTGSGNTVPLDGYVGGMALAFNADDAATTATCAGVSSTDPLSLCARLPVYVNGQPLGGGTVPIAIVVRLPRDPVGATALEAIVNAFDITQPAVSPTDPSPRLAVPPELGQALLNAVLDFDLLDGGIDGFLALVEKGLVLASGDGKLPLIGKDLQQGQAFVADLRTRIKTALGPLATLDLSSVTAGQVRDQAITALETQLGNLLAGASPTIGLVCGDHDCAPGENATLITGATFGFTIRRGQVTNGCTDPAPGSSVQPCLGPSVPLDVGLPGLSFSAVEGSSNQLSAKLGFRLHLKFGVDTQQGFFVVANDESQPEIQVGTAVRLPSSIQARIAFLKVTLQDARVMPGDQNQLPVPEPSSVPAFAGTFQVDLHERGANPCFLGGGAPACTSTGDQELGMADLLALGQVTDASLDGAVNVHWMFTVNASEALPGIGGRFNLAWSFAVPTEPGSTPTGLVVGFDQLFIDAGDFFGSILGPLIGEIKRFTSPLQPIIDTLYAPIPVLSELSRAVGGEDVSLASLAKAWNKLGGAMSFELVERVLGVIQLVNKLPSGGDAVPIGNFTLNAGATLSTENTPDAFPSLVGVQNALGGGDLRDEIDAAAPGTDVLGDGGAGEQAGLTFSVLEEPASLFGLLLGQDVELFRFDSGWLRIGFDYSQSFGPVYAPPPVMMTIAGSASISARIVAGFDTYGLRKAFEVGKPTPEILDSLYLVTVDESGTPLPVVVFGGRLGAGAELNLVAVKVGVQGGVFLTISLTWADPTNDGKFRFSEFLQSAIHNPLCLFNMDGILGLFLKVYVTLGISPFDVSFDYTLAEITLLDFSIKPDCEPPPPVLASGDGGTLVVHVGKLGTAGLRGPDWVDTSADEQVVVTELHRWFDANGDPIAYGPGESPPFIGFAVKALGIRQEFPGNYSAVLIDGRDHGGGLEVVLTGDGDPNSGEAGEDTALPFTKTAYVFGTDQADSITTGRGASFVDAGGGDDQVTTQDVFGGPAAVVAGGGGADRITVGGADEWVAGDAALAYSERPYGDATDTVDPTQPITHPTTPGENTTTDGADNIAVGRGDTQIWGGGGDDSMGVQSDDPRAGPSTSTPSPWKSQGVEAVGGRGSDRISGASGDDVIYTGRFKLATSHDGVGSTDVAGAINTVDSGSGDDIVHGSTRVDRVVGRSLPGQTDDFRGGADDDVLVGGLGTDTIFGGPDDDWVIAEPAEVKGFGPAEDQPGPTDGFGPTWQVSLLPLPTDVTPSGKTLVGGDDSDHIVGGRGPATIYGDRYHTDQQCELGTDPESTPPGESLFASESPGPDRILGGPGIDEVLAGGQNDWATTFEGTDRVCGQSGSDKLQGGPDADLLFGGSGGDTAYGEGGPDKVFGNGGNDGVFGGSDNDIVEGNDGADDAFGDTGSDLVLGGTRKAGARDVGHDDVFGGGGLDLLLGDNGDRQVPPDTRPPQPGISGLIAYDLDGLDTEAGDDDMVSGGTGDDVALAGLDGDVVFGNDGDDHLQGNNGDDDVHGNDGEDELIGGSAELAAGPGTGRPDGRDSLRGGQGPDLILGDNGRITLGLLADTSPVLRGRGFLSGHAVSLLDLGGAPAAGTSGGDLALGGLGTDVILGQGGPDRILGEEDDDHAEGGPDVDYVEGNEGQDDLVGGSSTPSGSSVPGTGTGASTGQPDGADVVWGGPSDDAAIGDNGSILRGAGISANRVFDRLGTVPATRVQARQVTLYDLLDGQAQPSTTMFGDDWVSGGSQVDVLWGQDGDDGISGGPGHDYVEGNGGDDAIRGDALLTDPVLNAGFTVPPQPSAAWKAYPPTGPALLEGSGEEGQDDLIGGSARQRFRDEVDGPGNDLIEGNGAGDMVLGDNGTLIRVVTGTDGSAVEAVDAARYSEDTGPPPDAFRLRIGNDAAAGYKGTARFCTSSAALGTQISCEPSWAYGDDSLWGDDGDDRAWGQDGSDMIRGGNGHDDLFGELGGDFLYGDAGQDAILGDRGGVLGEFIDAGDGLTETITIQQVPMESYVILRPGMLDRRTDLLADTDGTAWLGTDAAPVPHPGLLEGGEDRIRGGPGRDSIHAGWDNDLANGDGGGDEIFGDDGADVLWGGRGCEGTECPDGNTAFKGADKEFVDHVFGGRGGADADSDPVYQADIIDWNPRGSFHGPGHPDNQCTTDRFPSGDPGTVVDPCEWFVMTDKVDGDGVPDQHHHGTDWIYGGWDRDVMQGNESANGPSEFDDRLIDWNGAYNLYSHCNAAYGGFNDIRQHAPAMNAFLTGLAYGAGAGRGTADVTTTSSAAYRELAYTYPADNKDHGSGPAYPTTPGHFDEPAACGTD